MLYDAIDEAFSEEAKIFVAYSTPVKRSIVDILVPITSPIVVKP